MKKKLKASIDTADVITATRRRANVAVARTISRSSSATVVGADAGDAAQELDGNRDPGQPAEQDDGVAAEGGRHAASF
jgi:hypothetical protein